MAMTPPPESSGVISPFKMAGAGTVTPPSPPLVNLAPISDFLVVEMDPPPEDGVIYLPGGKARDNVPQTGIVRAQGPGRYVGCHGAGVARDRLLEIREPMPCQVGDRVVLQLNAGTEVRLDGREYRIVPARDIFGVRVTP